MVSLQSLVSKVSHSAGENRYPVLSITAGIGFVKQTEKFGKEIAGAQYVHYTVLKKGDFSYNKGNSNTYPQGCIYRQDDYEYAAVPNVFNSFRFVSPDCDTTYYKYLFESGYLNRQLSQMINSGVRNDGLLNIYDEDFYGCKVPCPPLEEQKRIAEILECCDRVIRLKRELIEEKKKKKKSLMQKLLNPNSGFRLPGFKGEWTTNKLCFVAPLQRGFDLPQSQMRQGTIPVICSNGVFAFHDTSIVKGPGVVTGRSGTIGSVIWVENDFWPHNTTLWVTDFCGNHPKYIYYLYSFLDFSRYSSGSGVPTLNRNDLHNMLVSIPVDIQEQKAIATILSSADHELDLLEQNLTQWELKKKSLMQLLLTGKVRV